MDKAQITPVEQGVGLLLVQLCRAHRNLVAGALEGLHVHVGQEHVVYRLAIEQGITQAQLAEALCVDASTVTKMLQRLERDGVVERRADPEDARVQRVYLTPNGTRLVQPVVDIWRGAEARLMAGMTEAEWVLARRLLLQMLSNLG
jgi:MarR family transcriptional regulator, organic hydroperoxide resistance regulator